MKGPLQTIDLSNDEEEAIGRTRHFFFRRIVLPGARCSVSQSRRRSLMG